MGIKTIAITMGDPAGIGPEIIVKALAEDSLNGTPVVVVGCLQTLKRLQEKGLAADVEFRAINEVAAARFTPGVIHVIDEPLADPQALVPGKVQAQAGDLAYRCVKRATALALKGDVQAIATAPLNKEALHLAGHNYPGHTELLATLTESRDYAMVLFTGEAESYPCVDAYRPTHIPGHPEYVPRRNRYRDCRYFSQARRLCETAHCRRRRQSSCG